MRVGGLVAACALLLLVWPKTAIGEPPNAKVVPMPEYAAAAPVEGESRSSAMWVTGMVLTIIGTLAFPIAGGLSAAGGCASTNPPSGCTHPARPVAVGVAIGGGVFLAMGIPLWIVGAMEDRTDSTDGGVAFGLSPPGPVLDLSF